VLSVLAGALVVTRQSLVGGLLLLILAWRILPAFWRAYKDMEPATIRSAVKAGVLSLVFLDAVIAAVYGGAIYGAILVLIALTAGLLARLFAVT